MRVVLDTPPGFKFRRTVCSHGWGALRPFEVGPDANWLEVTVALPAGGATRIRITQDNGEVVLEAPGRRNSHLVAAARRVLNLDLDLEPFYELARQHEEFAWIADSGSGRLMRCPSTFEDLAKLILTTNCTWALTTKMVDSLIEMYGETAPDGTRAFPGPSALARAGERPLREKAKTGYRAPLLAKMATMIAGGEIDLDLWEHCSAGREELKQEILFLPGAGPYVAENMLRFLGRPHGLGLDSWLRSEYATIYHGGRRVTDRTIARRYARFGSWAGMAIWCDLTRRWFDEEDRPRIPV
jgi:3-methyladenine DNA glycosylase/8-oxoguanine DNA glycosylase